MFGVCGLVQPQLAWPTDSCACSCCGAWLSSVSAVFWGCIRMAAVSWSVQHCAGGRAYAWGAGCRHHDRLCTRPDQHVTDTLYSLMWNHHAVIGTAYHAEMLVVSFVQRQLSVETRMLTMANVHTRCTLSSAQRDRCMLSNVTVWCVYSLQYIFRQYFAVGSAPVEGQICGRCTWLPCGVVYPELTSLAGAAMCLSVMCIGCFQSKTD